MRTDREAPHQDRLRVLVPGGTGTVGEGVVRGFLSENAEVVVPTRSARRSADFRARLTGPNPKRLHVLVHDYTTFAAADQLLDRTVDQLGGLDVVVAPIGSWWSGRTLTEISEKDWQDAFVALTTTHVAMLRASLPRLSPWGSYVVVVGDSAVMPIPGSGLMSMEQAALLMMQRVAAADAPDSRVFTFLLGQVRAHATLEDAAGVTAEQVGSVAAAIAASPRLASRTIPLHDDGEVGAAIRLAHDHR
jgi:3-oxoacyl-[acyl-carrier protein] reductase